jgi:hypothetical protein
MTLNSEVQSKPTTAVEHGAFFLGVRARNPNSSTVLFIHTVNQYSSTAIVSIDNIRTFPANMNLLIVALETSRKANLWPV